MAKVKKINVFAVAKFQALVLGFIGLILGITYSFGGAIVDTMVSLEWITTTETPGLSSGTALAFLALPVMPALLAGFGFITGIIEAFIYNLIAGWLGTVKIDFNSQA